MPNPDDLRAALDAYDQRDPYPPEDTPDDEWVIDPAVADALLRRRSAALRELAKIATLIAAERERLAAFEADLSAGPRNQVARSERLLENYARADNEDTGTTTWRLPHGGFKLNATQGKVVIADEDAFITWANESALELIRVSPVPAIGALRALPHVDGQIYFQGEAIPGLTWEDPGPRNFRMTETPKDES